MKPRRGETTDSMNSQASDTTTAKPSAEDIALADLYREAVVSHAAAPVGFQQEITPTHRFECYNPLCGDRIEMQFRVAAEVIEAAAFDGEACAICMASASMLCEAMPGENTSQIAIQQNWLSDALKNSVADPGLESLQALLAVRRYPSRIRCALLPWEAAVKAVTAAK